MSALAAALGIDGVLAERSRVALPPRRKLVLDKILRRLFAPCPGRCPRCAKGAHCRMIGISENVRSQRAAKLPEWRESCAI